jgi:hypothetical protein
MKNTLLFKNVFLVGSFLISFLLLPDKSLGQVNYVTWNFTTSITNANYSTSTSNQNAARSTALTSPTLSTISINGTGITGTNANTFHRTTGWPTALDNTKYLEFSVTLGAGQTFPNAAMSLAIAAGVSSITTAPRNYTVQYAWGAGSFAAVSGSNAASGAGTSGGTVTTLTTTQTTNTATIPAPGNTTTTVLKIRLLAYGTTSSTGNIQFGSIALTGAAPLTPATAPTVTTTAVSAITTNSATFAGNVTATGGAAITGNGTVYALTSANPAPAIGGTGVTDLSNGSPGAGIGTFSTDSGTVLSANMQYSYNAYATNSSGTSYGTAATFYTLANTPVAPVVSNPTAATLDVAIGSGDLNPVGTQYAIEINGSGNYVQANGTSTGAAVWQTAAQWATTTVTGLTASTLYSFRVYARNGANTPTTFGTSATGTTAAITSPTLTLGTLPAFGNVCINTTPTANSFTISGINLTSDVTIGPLANFSFSTTEAGTYTNSVTLSPNSGTIAQTSIYVKFTPTAVQSYSATPIPVSGGGASATSVAVSGSGTNIPVAVSTGANPVITSTTASLGGSFEPGCSPVTSTGIQYSVNNDFSGGTQQTGTFPVLVSNLSPNTLYYFRSFAIDDTGTVYGGPSSFTTSAIGTPTGLAATNITQTSFTANWTAVAGATSYRLDVSASPTFGITTPTTNLFISEYGEGSTGNKKYIELYNGTGASVNLANYQIWGINNGGTWPESTLSLSGTLANGQTYVIANNSTDNPGANVYSNLVPITFNGNDAVGLAYNGGSGTNFTLIDGVGTSGVDPGTGWAVAGTTNATADHILIRKASVLGPNSNWTTSAGTTVGNSEWTVSASTYSTIGQNTDTGSHTISNTTQSFVSPYQDFTVNGTSQVVSGLTPHTQYYYRVRAFSANSLSPSSTPISVTTLAETPTFGGIIQAAGTICSGSNGNFTITGLVLNSISTISYTINGGDTQTVANVTANGAGTATMQVPLVLANNGQTLAITAVQRTDFAADVLTVSSNNTVVIGNVSGLVTYYGDADGDGFGDIAVPLQSCTGAPTYSGHIAVNNSTDCDDSNSSVFRTGEFFTDADNDGYYNGNPVTVTICYGVATPLGFTLTNIGSDCNDNDPNINSNHVEVPDNGIDDNCDGTIDEDSYTTTLIPSQCGITLNHIANTLYASLVPAAEGYRFEVSQGDNIRTYDSATNSFSLMNLEGGIAYGTTYTIRVAVKVNGFWRSYFTSCDITSPSAPATTNVVAAQCGSTLALMSTTIYADQVTAANQYRFEVTNGSNVRTYDSAVNRFSLTNLSGTNAYATTYVIRVALRFGAEWQDYGTACAITTPATPGFARISNPSCGSTISNSWTTIYATPVADAAGYRFRVVNGATTRFYDSAVPRFNLHNLAGAAPAPNTAYTVSVAILYNSVYHAFGPSCVINTAGVITRQADTAISVFDVKAYPNPFTGSFKIGLNTSIDYPVEMKVYDMLGRAIESRTSNVSEMVDRDFGDNYPSGVYNIIVTQGDHTETLRVIKR